jgi:hypothetical protein
MKYWGLNIATGMASKNGLLQCRLIGKLAKHGAPNFLELLDLEQAAPDPAAQFRLREGTGG